MVIGGGIGLTGIALLIAFNYLTGGDYSDVLTELENVQVTAQQDIDTTKFEGADDYEVFVSTILGSNNDAWIRVFAEANLSYLPPHLVLFRRGTESACGGAVSEVGPHYCSLDETIYLDETFFEELKNRFGASGGDVAEAYVIAHEVGHHVQNEFNIMDEVYGVQESSPDKANDLSVRLELQADCFAGLWAYSIKDQGIFLPGEINEAMDAAAAVGDDRVQESQEGYINQETWTHGSSEQRVQWFTTGYTSGRVADCDTFQ